MMDDMVETTVTEIMADLKAEDQRQEWLAQMARDVDQFKPESVSFVAWYSSSARATLATEWAEKWSRARYDEHIAALKRP